MEKLSPAELKKLTKIAEAQLVEPWYTLVKEKAAKNLLKLAFIECNLAIGDADSGFATRATQAGLDYLESLKEPEVPNLFPECDNLDPVLTTEEIPLALVVPEEAGTYEVGQAAPSRFELESNIPLPKSRRRVQTMKYPFDVMEVGQSFHVAPTEKNPSPSKSLASTVSSAKNRYKDSAGNPTRNFVIRTVDSSDPKGPGARVFRLEDFENE
jgi:hypothetical protein